MNFRGTIIEESLEDRKALQIVDVQSTKVKPVTANHQTPWLKQWTIHTILVPEAKAAEVAEMVSRAIDPHRSGSWYVEFNNDKKHYIIFRNKVFVIDAGNNAQYDEAVDYGLAIGIPRDQLDFKRVPAPFSKHWTS